ncbi:MAG: tetratricopeptide repeat protein [Deinococcales bacterium]
MTLSSPSSETSKELRRLRILIEDTEDKGVLIFALYNLFADVEGVQKQLSQQLGQTIALDILEKEQLDPLKPILGLDKDKRKIIFVVYRGDLGEELNTMAGYANYGRELLKDVPHVLVMWLSSSALPLFIAKAPDFWAWHSGGLFDFESPLDTNLETREGVTRGESFGYEGYEPSKLLRQLDNYAAIIKAQEESSKPDDNYIARTYLNMSKLAGNLGKHQEALQYSQKALELAEEQQDEALIAQALNSLGVNYSDLGKRQEAFKATERAVDIREKLAQSNPDAFLPDLATSLNNLGKMYSDLGQRSEALKATERSVAIREKLAQSNPDAFLPDLAMSLNNLGIRYSNLGQRSEALKATERAVASKSCPKQPDAFCPI